MKKKVDLDQTKYLMGLNLPILPKEEGNKGRRKWGWHKVWPAIKRPLR